MAADEARRLQAVPAGDEESPAAGASESSPAAAPPATSPRWLAGLQVPGPLVRIAVGVIAVGLMTTGLFFLVTDVLLPGLGPARAAPAQPEAQGAGALPGNQFKVDEIIVNPAGTHGRRFLRLGVALEAFSGAGGEAVLGELEARQAQVRDLFIREFSSRTLEELTDPTVREELRAGCQEKINGLLVKGKIAQLYFTDYVLQ
ncbi:MAG: flagellar basal body-associated FliL family protein [Candidatus Eisenbacteria bacterium]|uniref:Flagellar protein FliL n=1 Tax=Eiseniibacteriota bacterium TaxID=2212470 RepID=A0A938BQS7_UNCEI|nr:flagellar basal body-associated FliL family protein [Candidatus Eisenbacteria bacterium]